MWQLLRRRTADRPTVVSYRAAPYVVAGLQGERTVLLDPKRGEYYGMDEVGGEIWRMLGAGATLAQLVSRLESLYDVPRALLERDTAAFLALLQRKRLVSVV